ncbi:MAG: tRNA uridine-5-carboxymethylaminomethyl(34) synthesis GTPase MnmE [Alphaproteobacteria bacterium]|nr:tRNA uridine-5-carboxymethylaminomethyl(34) synthesis GTPase MnmE [Alphaproteobacteria bacterium]
MKHQDTIFALASGLGRAGVAVIRVSGKQAADVLKSLTYKGLPKPRRAVLRDLAAGGALIDRALCLWFVGPASYTGEDLVELHVHGGRAVVEALLAALRALPGCRLAEPGEFTRRAVENGKLDLTRAEAIADLVDAETEAQRRQALRQFGGALGSLIEEWRQSLLQTLAWAEAAIDFSEEELPADMLERTRAETVRTLRAITGQLADGRRGELVRDGLFVAVLGPPNAGKSSLVNALAGRDVAIVSETAGTTRDVIEVRLDFGGYPVTLADTAGLRQVFEAVEAEGVRRALGRAEAADLVLLLLDGSALDPRRDLPENMVKNEQCLVVWNKADLPWPERRSGLAISLKTGQGLDALVAALTAQARDCLERPGEAVVITRARHRAALEEAAATLERAVEAREPELFAEDLRLALRALGRVTGQVDVEDLLDVIFRDFCIGK